jgi:hypothetical protein
LGSGERSQAMRQIELRLHHVSRRLDLSTMTSRLLTRSAQEPQNMMAAD